MHVFPHAHLPAWQQGGEHGIAAAGAASGVAGFEVWVRTLQPGAASATLCHHGALVVLALGGSGRLRLDAGPLRFTGPCTLVLPAGQPFQFANPGPLPLQLVWVFTDPPRAPDGG